MIRVHVEVVRNTKSVVEGKKEKVLDRGINKI